MDLDFGRVGSPRQGCHACPRRPGMSRHPNPELRAKMGVQACAGMCRHRAGTSVPSGCPGFTRAGTCLGGHPFSAAPWPRRTPAALLLLQGERSAVSVLISIILRYPKILTIFMIVLAAQYCKKHWVQCI